MNEFLSELSYVVTCGMGCAVYRNCNRLMATITKRDLVVRISNETGLTQQQVFDVVQKTLDAVTLDLAQGNTVVMRNFGTFEVRQTKAKVGRNPKDPGKDVPIPPRAVVKFKPGKEMKEKVARILPVIQQQIQVDLD